MRAWPKLLAMALAMTLILVIGGCSDEQSGGLTEAGQINDNYEDFDFAQEYGGLTATDEDEAFADPYLLQLTAEEEGEVIQDPLAEAPEVRRLERQLDDSEDPRRPRPRFTFLRITWGMLAAPVDSLGRPEEGPELLSWSGLMRVDRGLVIVRRVIRFERPVDHVVFPRLDPQAVAWFSATGNHFDGLLVEIIERPRDLDPAGDLEPNMLHFETALFSRSFPVAELPGLDDIFPVEPEPNAIHFTGFNLADINICPKGFLSGIWHTQGDSTGAFRGRWVGLSGHLQGFLRGGYGYDENGQRVMVGKFISRTGQFRGLLRGTWEPVAERPGHGLFHAHWVNRAGTVEGELGGQYLQLPDRPGGFFAGRWAAQCDEEALAEIP